MSEPEITCKKAGCCGLIKLSRPKALNALTLNMVREMAAALDRWESDPGITRVIITGAGGRAFCAGGDIRILYDLGKAGRHAEQLCFWREEYRLNRRIKLYPKPYLAIADGFVMGGGAGVSLHGTHMIAGENFTFAMPEVGIGFVPDAGATYFLPRMPANIGVYLALTGARLSCGDALAFKVASSHVPSARHAALVGRLIEGEPIEAAISTEKMPPPASELYPQTHIIARCFTAGSLAAILARADEAALAGSEFARSAACAIRVKSPTSLAIALHQMQIGAAMDIDSALVTEFRIVSRIALGDDYYEGVRAMIIDKDNHPSWNPGAMERVNPADIEAYFAPLPEGELDFDTRSGGN
ncbi:MAG: enoyl-CoA hydratase/isomerase family protein [Beijerinckiaceae bacterium]|nr:enoyl-CoA hydratase/isomerase family protein [Beijerinckiaceae bacterium]